MKPTLKSFSLLFLFVFTTQFSFSQSAGEYMNSMSSEFSKIKNDYFDYVSQVSHGKSARKADSKRQEVISTVKSSRSKIAKVKAFNGSTTLRDSVLAYLDITYNVLTQDYSKILDLESNSNNSYDLMVAYMKAQEDANIKMNNAADLATRAQRKFASENGLTMNESEDAKDRIIKIANNVIRYKTRLDLILFKNSFEEQKMLKALSVNDNNAVQSSRAALIESSKESLKILDTMPPYKGDGSVESACRNLLVFYQDEATNQITSMLAFSVIKEEFERVRKVVESKPKSAVTKAEADQYNAAVKKYNDAINAYNSKSDALNTKRTTLTDAYNNSAAVFLDRQVPKK
jgi:hypothetical protein